MTTTTETHESGHPPGMVVRPRTSTMQSIKRKPVAGGSISKPAIQQPVTLQFVFGPFGLHCWYDSTAIETSREEPAEGEEEAPSRHWSGVNEARRWIVAENPIQRARTIQLYCCSPRWLTAYVYVDSQGAQQQKVVPPQQGLIQKFGKMKREYERSLIAEQDLSAWLTRCLINNIAPKDLQIRFGPDESFFARSPDERVVRRGLPIDLAQLLDSHDKPPSDLSLGIDGTWWVLWPDGTQEQYIQQNSYPDLCTLLETIEVPQLKRIMLNPAKANEFIVQYANNHFFIRASCQPQDIQNLNDYLLEQKSDIKIIMFAILHNVLGRDIVCEPFVLPTENFAGTPLALGKEVRPGQLPEWMEYTKGGIELAKTVTEIAQAGGACRVM